MEHSINREPQPCIMVQLACPKCGPVRMALAPQDDPITSLECPYCSTESMAEQIGDTQTTRQLPYFEFEGLFRTYAHAIAKSARRIESGETVIYCQEMDILHLAVVGDVHTSSVHLSPGGPAISFIIAGQVTEPTPHLSGCGEVPPFWCWPDELAGKGTEANVPAAPESQKTRRRKGTSSA